VDLHEPVLVREVIESLRLVPQGWYLDGTCGTGGHAEAISSELPPSSRLVCLDQDPEVIEIARARLGAHGERVSFFRGSFSGLDEVLEKVGISAFDGILLDLGLNTWSLAQPHKGLSYLVDGPLRMDVDPDLPQNAEQYLRHVTENELADVFAEFGGVRRPRLFARKVVAARARGALRTTYELVRAFTGDRPGDLGPAELSRLFQAIRVVVGQEMERLEEFLRAAPRWVAAGGRLVILTYASHEDRRVKELARPGGAASFVPVHKKPIAPGAAEIERNRRARSARLRCFERKGGT